MSRVRYTKEDWWYMALKRIHAFKQIAAMLGKDHAITTMMWPLAWGRNDMAQGPETTATGYIEEKAYLDGCFHILNLWARDHDSKAQGIMLDLYPRGYESAKKGSPDG